MKNTILFFLALFVSTAASAQTIINRNYPVKSGQKLLLKFDYPVVKVSTWDKNEIAITGKVSINGGESDDAFILQDRVTDGTLEISSLIQNMDKLPRRYTVIHNGTRTIFKTAADMNAFRTQSNDSIRSYSEGVDFDIILEIKVPAGISTNLKSTFGLVELADFNAPINVDATYGSIDATLVKSRAGQIKATTKYGKIYSNLDLTLTDKKHEAFFTSITAAPGVGPAYTFSSDFGKIYLRNR